MLNLWWRRYTRTGFWCGNLRERDHTEDLRVDGKIILKWILKLGW
jgi:hypothetical protein